MLTLRDLERRVNMLLQICCSLETTSPGYRYVWKFTSIVQFALDILFTTCRNMFHEECTDINSVVNTLVRRGVLSKRGADAALKLHEVLTRLTSFAGQELMEYMYSKRDEILDYVMTVSHELLSFIDRQKRQ